MAQTITDLEVIVVDDASPREPATSLLAHYNRSNVRVITNTCNMGASAARNVAGRAASGTFILPLDSDDLLEPAYLERTLPALEDPRVGGVYTAVQCFGDDDALYDQEWTMEGVLSGKAGALVCMLYRKAMFDQLDGYDTRWRVGEDSDFFLRGLKAGWSFVRKPEPLYRYRKHHTSATAAKPSRDLKEMQMNILKYHPELCSEHLTRIIEYKEDRYWTLHDEYKHLHDEFHKLLALYENLESGVRLNAAGKPNS